MVLEIPEEGKPEESSRNGVELPTVEVGEVSTYSCLGSRQEETFDSDRFEYENKESF